MTDRASQSVAGVVLTNVQVGGNLIISGVTIQLPAEPPPLWVNVPSLPNHFLGRDELVDDLVTRLLAGQSAALSAEGLPGVGKTTLAVVLAHHPTILDHFSDGVLWAGLGPTPDVPSQLASWATALGIDVSDRPTPAARAQAVRNAIGQRRLLLVIDDAWHGEAADLMRCGGPGCSHLLTTRDQAIARHFAGAAQQVSVPTLADDPAFALLQTLAPEACAADPVPARALARTVDGLPLALELLGGYLAAPERSYFAELSAAAFDELADPARRLALATRRLGASDDAQVTLRETIALSLEELPQDAVAAFHALGAFAPKPATFSLEAAEAVTEAGAATLALLAARNLLERSDSEAERLWLHQVLADVARTKLALAAIERHRDYYLALVDEDREDWRRIQPVYPQAMQAWGWEVEKQSDDERLFDFNRALRTFQERQGLWSDYGELVATSLTLARRREDIAGQAWLLNQLGYMYDALGEKQEALATYEQALPLWRQVGDRSGEATTLNNIGLVYSALGEKQEALAYYKQALPLFWQVGDRSGEATTVNNIGLVYEASGNIVMALSYFHSALFLNRQIGNAWSEARTLCNVAKVYDAIGKKKEALQYYDQVLPIFRQAGDRDGEATALHNIGFIYDALGKKHDALTHFDQALSLRRQIGDKVGEATTLNNIGSVYYSQGENQQALDCFLQAIPTFSQAGDRAREAATLNNIGAVCRALGQKQEAVQYYHQALALSRQVGDLSSEVVAMVNMGRVYDSLDEKQKALEYYRQALPVFRYLGDRAGEAATLNNLASLYVDQGDYERSAEMFSSVTDIAQQLGAVGEEALYLFNHAHVLHHYLNDTAGALALVQRSVHLLRQNQLLQDAAGLSLAQHEAFLAQLSGKRKPLLHRLFGK